MAPMTLGTSFGLEATGLLAAALLQLELFRDGAVALKKIADSE